MDHFSRLFVVKVVLLLEKTENKLKKKSSVVHFDKKTKHSSSLRGQRILRYSVGVGTTVKLDLDIFSIKLLHGHFKAF